MRQALTRAGRGLLWYLKEVTGEARWDEYVAQCRAHGHEPMPRREFERQRSDLKESSTQARCC